MATTQRSQIHVAELAALKQQELYGGPLVLQGRFWLISALLFYIARWIGTFFRFLISAPFALALSPISALYSLILYPFLFLFFGGLAIGFFVFDLLGGGDLLNRISRRYAPNVVVPPGSQPVGYTIANWTNPYMLNAPSTTATINDARLTLSGRRPTTIPPPIRTGVSPDFPPNETQRIFDVDVAKTFAWMIALVYERVDKKVYDASEIADPPSSLCRSEIFIKEQAKRWGFAYEGISDLATLGGPFSSIFYTPVDGVAPATSAGETQPGKELPFMVLALKGTTPVNYSEFLVNGTVSTVPATPFFGAGQVHEGYYGSLFNSNAVGVDGYGQILNALKSIAAELRNAAGGASTPRIPLWITGHSLGGCLASLVFARLLHEPRDLGSDIELKDAYNIGTLRLGNGDFVNKFEEELVSPTDRPNILFRLVMPKDFGPRIVPGLADDEGNRGILPDLSPLNFAHLSSATITFTSSDDDQGYRVTDSNFHTRTRIVVVRQSGARGSRRSPREDIRALPPNWLRFGLSWLLPSFLFNHYPSSYVTRLDQMRLG